MAYAVRTREVAKRTGLPHTKIKRYAREFLGYDPRVRMQGGRAREYTVRDAFRVYLGGRLVHDLGYSILEAKHILKDLWPWLEAKGMMPEGKRLDNFQWTIWIMNHPQKPGRFRYYKRGVMKRQQSPEEKGVVIEKYIEEFDKGLEVDSEGLQEMFQSAFRPRVLNISALWLAFRYAMEEE